MMAAGVPPPGPPGGGPFDQLGQMIADAIGKGLDAFSRGAPGRRFAYMRAEDQPEAQLYGNRIVNPEAPRPAFDVNAPVEIPNIPLGPRAGPLGERTEQEIERFRHWGGNIT
jgi:hypothetical protein